MTEGEENDAWWQGALNACAVLCTLFFCLWVILPPWKTPICPSASTAVAAPAPAPAPPPETLGALEERLTHQLCDREVDALLNSHELIEVERASTIIRQVNCGIERRL